MFRIGHGFDVHKFGGQGPCVLGGVKVPYEQGLLAHSDGDVVLHAISDALLGALSLGDIGHFFPDNDDKYLNIDSRILLRQVVAKVHELGYVVNNVDTTILAQAPKMAAYEPAMRENVAADLNIDSRGTVFIILPLSTCFKVSADLQAKIAPISDEFTLLHSALRSSK